MVKIKGHEIDSIIIKDAGNRRAMQFKNNIVTVLRRIGVNENDIDIPLERIAMKKAKASATWYLSDHRMHYSHNLQSKYVENLHVLSKVIEIEVNRVLSEEKTLSDFILEFKEDSDVYNKRKEAREFFDCDHDETDFEIINKKYKSMAKELHPDMPTGDTEKFKKLNIAHKILKRELT
ncbi:J domain-containing protein [Methanococcoides sp. NM1]|uniref:J domain-containing protein n=1 Tax=Methanococcoides sp. NM1 TaxID=1201013 RepID=UPI0010836173|nr:J domain-containing protein [Methanococcoides sp. NM1]